MEKNYKEILHDITTFIFDVDGVLTNGTIEIMTNGELVRKMNVKDGYALKTAIEKGYNIAIISGGFNEGVRTRLEGLGISDIYLKIHDKLKVYDKYCKSKNIKSENILYMGDDIPDAEVMKSVALPTAPKNADSEILRIAKYISHKKGGNGCVRDVIEQVLRVQKNWL